MECSPNIREAWVQTVEMHTPHPAGTARSPRDLAVEASAGVTLDYRVSATLVSVAFASEPRCCCPVSQQPLPLIPSFPGPLGPSWLSKVSFSS